MKLVHLVGFVIRIYHDARSPERQKVLDIEGCENIRLYVKWEGCCDVSARIQTVRACTDSGTDLVAI